MKAIVKALARIISAEIIKLRGTFALWLSILYPLGSVMLVSLIWYSQRNKKNINPDQFITDLSNAASFFLPFFIVLLISVACNTEHKSSMMKHILALPIPRPLFYLGKFLGIMLFIAFAFILTIVLAYCVMLIFGIAFPNLGFRNSFNHLLLFRAFFRVYFAASAIYTIQYWLGMRLKNLTLPVAIGAALIILPIAILIVLGIAGLMNNSENFTQSLTYNPYSYPYSAAFSMMQNAEFTIFPTLTLIYIFVSFTALLFGAFDFSRRDVV
jgi:hypothetical protein